MFLVISAWCRVTKDSFPARGFRSSFPFTPFPFLPVPKTTLDILAALRKPLEFASRDGFAGLRALKGVEPLVGRLAEELAEAGTDPQKAEDLRALFRGFDSAADAERREAVTSALDLIARMGGGRPPVTEEPSPYPQPPELTGAELKTALERLSTPLKFVKGVGPKLAERFSAKGLHTVEDILCFFPLRYEDRRAFARIKDITPGVKATVEGEILAKGEARYGRRRVFEAAIGDGTGILKLKWFNYRLKYMGRYTVGRRVKVYGNVSAWGGNLEIIHPDVEIVDNGKGDGGSEGASDEPEGLVPVYSSVENLHQKTLRKIISSAVDGYADSFIGGLPGEVRGKHRLMPSRLAVREVHQPGTAVEGRPLHEHAVRSLVFDELFTLELGLALRREKTKKEPGHATASGESPLEKRLRSTLPFTLTGAQERVLREVASDMASPHPMNRLVQGDVGSGKTVVSLIAALRAIDSGFQAAIMAPTEILAEQHYLNVHGYAEALGMKPLLLTGRLTRAARRENLEKISSGAARLVVGTHALIQKDVEFKRLGLVIVDEQHRFGVVQRAELKRKAAEGLTPDTLIMTATPIPRTLSMTVFGDLDVSVIDELPPGRTPIKTRIMREKDREKAYNLVRRELARGGQAYIVYPLVEESEELELKDATNMREHLDTEVFPDHRVGLLHGRMKSAEKESVMREFKDRELDILVATTVIEVGVDVPNATVMLIEHAERFGLSQLHQLRGRVGRGERESHCLLLAQWTKSEDTYRRLQVMEATTDGFRIAEEDLKIRGPGDFLGTRQSGLPDFRISFALGDLRTMKAAREEAFHYLKANPTLTGPEGERMREVLKRRWAERLELAEIG